VDLIRVGQDGHARLIRIERVKGGLEPGAELHLAGQVDRVERDEPIDQRRQLVGRRPFNGGRRRRIGPGD
jgi:hypothetical protein